MFAPHLSRSRSFTSRTHLLNPLPPARNCNVLRTCVCAKIFWQKYFIHSDELHEQLMSYSACERLLLVKLTRELNFIRPFAKSFVSRDEISSSLHMRVKKKNLEVKLAECLRSLCHQLLNQLNYSAAFGVQICARTTFRLKGFIFGKGQLQLMNN